MHHRSMLNCLGLFKCSLSPSLSAQPLIVFFPKGCVRTLLAPMQALSIVSMPPKPFWCMPRFPLITRVATLLQCACFCHRTTNKVRAVQTHCGSRSLVSVCTIYRRVVKPHSAVLGDKKSASKAPFCLIF